VTSFWNHLPADRAVRLVGADAEAIATSLEPLPPDAPAVVTYYPHAETIASKVVDAMLRELETAAIELFPAWLPAAAPITSPGGVGVAAVRTVAKQAAAISDHYGPFLAALAECGLRRSANGLTRFPREIRAAGLVRVLKNSYTRSNAVILVPVPADLPSACQQALASASEWMAQHGHVGIWLAGSLEARERIVSVTVKLPGHLAAVAVDGTPEFVRIPAGPVLLYPPIFGQPHHASAAEQKLEEALLKRPWAAGRRWNQTYRSHPLVNAVRLDLWWPDERCVVEVDGPDHRSKWKYAEDRRRDRMLDNDGLKVLRFTNAEVLGDLDMVLAAIENCLQKRRSRQEELSNHV
jgi:very-short-patch-repair endonuclease